MGDLGSVPRLGRSPGGGHATHSSILAWRITVDRGAWQATVHGVAKRQTLLTTKHCTEWVLRMETGKWGVNADSDGGFF